jgi:hypothetical protein
MSVQPEFKVSGLYRRNMVNKKQYIVAKQNINQAFQEAHSASLTHLVVKNAALKF